MMTPKKRSGPGRPPEGRVKVTLHLLPMTLKRVRTKLGVERNTMGKVVDAAFDRKDKGV